MALIVFGFRFILGIAGVFTMGWFFDVIRHYCGKGSRFVKTLSALGRETLAIYILQSICIEIGIKRVFELVYKHCPIVFSLSFVNLVGYVIAPVLSLFAIYVLNKVVVEIKSVGILKNIFGFKIR